MCVCTYYIIYVRIHWEYIFIYVYMARSGVNLKKKKKNNTEIGRAFRLLPPRIARATILFYILCPCRMRLLQCMNKTNK